MHALAAALPAIAPALGPKWMDPTYLLQQYGEAMPYLSAAAFLLLTLVLSVGFQVTEPDTIPAELLNGR